MSLTEFLYEINLKKLNQYDKLFFEQSNHIKLSDLIINENKVINEHVLNKIHLTTLFNTIMQGSYVSIFSNLKIASLLPKNLKITRNLKHLDIPNKLYVFTIPFDKDYLEYAYEIIISKTNILTINPDFNILEFKNQINDLFKNNPNSTALFVSFKDCQELAFMFLNGPDTTEDNFRHEFIHYYQWSTNDDLIDLNESITVPSNINLITNKPINKSILNLIYKKHEVIPYINELIDQLNDFEMTRKDFHKYFKDNRKFVWHNETDAEYVERLSNTEFFSFIKNHNLNLIPFLIFTLLEIFEPDFKQTLKVTILSQLLL